VGLGLYEATILSDGNRFGKFGKIPVTGQVGTLTKQRAAQKARGRYECKPHVDGTIS